MNKMHTYIIKFERPRWSSPFKMVLLDTWIGKTALKWYTVIGLSINKLKRLKESAKY